MPSHEQVTVPEPILAAFRFQRDTVPTSPLYRRLLTSAIDDAESGGICAELLAQTPDGVDPVLDALPLRFLGGVHRLVLDGIAPSLAVFYPSAGGRFEPDDPACDPTAAFLETVAEHRGVVVEWLARSVQTNEVGRCAALLPGFLRVAASTGLPLRVLELGTSAGLNLRWDHYRYAGGLDGSAFGPADALLRFDSVYAEPRPPLDIAAVVVERRGCDRNPIDATSEEGRQLLRSFVWADQLDRLSALDAALAVAATVEATIDQADAAEWVALHLADVRVGAATVLFQSIVWQYLTPETRAALQATVLAAGAAATTDAPVAWLRMEPGVDPTSGAEVRLALWPSGEDRLVARCGYHGRPVTLSSGE